MPSQEDGTGRAFVVGARGATGFVLTVGSEVFEESGRSLVRGTLDYLQGLKVFLVLHFLSFLHPKKKTLLTQEYLMCIHDLDAWSQAY